MEMINDVLHFLNYLDFVGDLRGDDYSNFNHIKKLLKDIFQDVDSEQVIHTLGVIDDLRIVFPRQDFHEIGPLTESLRDRNFTKYEKKTIEEQYLDTLNKANYTQKNFMIVHTFRTHFRIVFHHTNHLLGKEVLKLIKYIN